MHHTFRKISTKTVNQRTHLEVEINRRVAHANPVTRMRGRLLHGVNDSAGSAHLHGNFGVTEASGCHETDVRAAALINAAST